ncbi:MAG: hypothetical protein IJF52_03670 [Clostridia bacterium]|nr:hypothetical protein [Clostridia bacterium]
MGTRNDWANVGRDFKKLGSDFGKTFIKTVKNGTQKIEDWAMDDNTQTAQEPVAEATVVSESEDK